MIYFIRSGKRGPIKIGYTENNIEGRIRELQCGSPEPLTLMGVMPGDISKEKELHEKFKEHRMVGEWFKPITELKHFIFGNTDFDIEYISDKQLLSGIVDLNEIIKEVETSYITRALELTEGRIQKAAEILGLSFRTIRYRIQKYKIKV